MKLTELTTYQTTMMEAKAHRVVKTKVSYFLREYNLTMMQWVIIGSLYQAGQTGMRVSDLANKLDTSLAFITTTLNVLEAKGMVERAHHSQDNRAKIVKITTSFEPKIQEIEQHLIQKFRTWIVPIVGMKDLETYFDVIDKIATHSDN